VKTVILGAGITGLTAAWKIGDADIYEASDGPGGISMTYRKSGFTFEKGGGHWIFGHGRAIDFLRQFGELKEYKRDAGIYFNKILPYPIQTFTQSESEVNPGTMKAWFHGKFSKDLCSMFFDPWSESYTAGLYNNVAQDDPAKTPDPRGSGYNDCFYYPKHGFDSIIKKLASTSKIEYKKEATRIFIKVKVVEFSDGSDVEYDRLISTIPLNKLYQICDLPENLPYNSTSITNIGAYKGPNTPKEHWLYIPLSKSNIYRVGFYSNVHKESAPGGDYVSIYVEQAIAKGIPVSSESKIINELSDWGFIGGAVYSDQVIIPCGYTWVYPGRDPRPGMLESMREYDIHSIGRYGKWKFQGISASVEDGLDV
jgi:protoporphyrinogen oxidase